MASGDKFPFLLRQEYDEFKDQTNSQLSENKNLIEDIYIADPEIELSWELGYWNQEGLLSYYADYCHSNYIKMDRVTHIQCSGLSGVGGEAAAVTCIFVDDYYNLIGVITTQSGFDVDIDENIFVNFEDIAYVSLNNSDINNVAGVILNLTYEQTELSKIIGLIDLLQNDQNSIKDKVVYTLGDSIGYIDNAWTFQFAKKTGAKKLYNLSRGGATWADKDPTVQIDYDENSPIWNNDFTYITSLDNLTESYDGNTDLSLNIIPSSDQRYTTISNEIRFMKRLIDEYGRPEPDIVIIAAGINDTRNTTINYSDEIFNSLVNTPFDDMTAQQKNSIGGGLRWCIESLMTDYPNAVIQLATPIQSAYAYLRPYIKNTCAWIKAFSEYYSCQLIDSYSESGISAVFELGWDDETYVNTNAGRYLYDGLHPSEEGRILQANYMAKRCSAKYCSKI